MNKREEDLNLIRLVCRPLFQSRRTIGMALLEENPLKIINALALMNAATNIVNKFCNAKSNEYELLLEYSLYSKEYTQYFENLFKTEMSEISINEFRKRAEEFDKISDLILSTTTTS